MEITTKAMKDSDRTSGTSGSEGSGSTGAGTTGSGQSGMSSGHDMGKKVQVTAVRELAGSCSGQ